MADLVEAETTGVTADEEAIQRAATLATMRDQLEADETNGEVRALSLLGLLLTYRLSHSVVPALSSLPSHTTIGRRVEGATQVPEFMT